MFTKTSNTEKYISTSKYQDYVFHLEKTFLTTETLILFSFSTVVIYTIY